MKKIWTVILFISAFINAQDNYYIGQYIDVFNRKFDVQIKEYDFDDNITSLYYKENDSEQELSLPIEQVELFTYKKGREIFIFREVNFISETLKNSYENEKKILTQLIASGENTSLFFRNYNGQDEFFLVDNFKEVIHLTYSKYKKVISNNFKLDDEEIKDYSFDKLSLTLLVNYINSYNLSDKTNKTVAPINKKVELSENFQVPIYTGCKKKSHEEKMKCFNQGFMDHFAKNFQFPEKIKNNHPNLNIRIYLYFIIEKDGTISLRNILNSPFNELIIELIRVFKLMPKITAATVDNYPVKVKYTIPITLKID